MSQGSFYCGLFMTPAATNEAGAAGVAATSALPAPIAINPAEDVYRFYLQQQEPWAPLPRLARTEHSRSYAPQQRSSSFCMDDIHGGSMISKSIPIRSTITKTPSEVQLCEDERVADYRDYVVFSRIVDHITRQQFASRNLRLRYENDDCLLNIIRTRQGDSDFDEDISKEEEEEDVAMHTLKSQEPTMNCNPGYFFVTDQDTNTCFSTAATTLTPYSFAHNSNTNNSYFGQGQMTFLGQPTTPDDDEEMFLLEM